MSAALRLFGLAGADEGARISPNCWRICLALAHRQLSVETIPWRFIEKAAIAFSGQGKVLVLVDGDRCVVDSWIIAGYLEDRYSDRPSLFGEAAGGLSLGRFVSQWTSKILHSALAFVIVPDLANIPHAKDRDYFRATREAAFRTIFEPLAAAHVENLATPRRVVQRCTARSHNRRSFQGAAPHCDDHVALSAFQWARVSSPITLLASDDPIGVWCARMLDACGGLARATPAAV